MKFFSFNMILSLLILLSQFAFAQSSKTKVTKLNFEDELIQGDLSSPDLLLILKSKNPNYGRLLNLRDDFMPELRDTRYEVLRGAD